MKKHIFLYAATAFLLITASSSFAGPWSDCENDPGKIDSPIPGFTGPAGDGVSNRNSSGEIVNDNTVNPIFTSWATGYINYTPSPASIPERDGLNIPGGGVATRFRTPEKATGPINGDHFEIVSLGDLSQTQIENGVAPGEITMTFDFSIQNGEGADFAVFENGFIDEATGNFFAELAFVEVSTDGINFARFNSQSLTDSSVGPYDGIDPTDVYNLAGKHCNAYTSFWGTPFDLETLTDAPLVLDGTVDLDDINFVRLIDIPGTGIFTDSEGRPIYDAWETWGSGGLDLDAIGVINSTVPTPVPAAAWLLASGLLGIAGITRKKHS